MITENSFLTTLVLASEWLRQICLFVGLVISMWAFLRCWKRGYLLVGVYFALCVFLHPVLNKHFPRQHEFVAASTELRTQLAELEEKKYELISIARANGEYNTINNNPVGIFYAYFSWLYPMLLVLGLWLIARRETPQERTPHA